MASTSVSRDGRYARRVTRPPTYDPLAPTLGWASLTLGIPQVLMPGRFARAIGVRDDLEARAWTFAVGVRELMAAAGILALGKPRPTGWLWARVAGDGMDLALLVSALVSKRENTARLLGATGAVVLIGATDIMAALRMAKEPELRAERGPVHVHSTITTLGNPENLSRRWADFADGRSREASVRFVPAPGDRGTEIHAELELDPPPGPIGAVSTAVLGEKAEQELSDDLRRFKQLVETGVIVRSEGTPEGPHTVRLVKQRPAQPLAGVAS
jgi:hypothetical protein